MDFELFYSENVINLKISVLLGIISKMGSEYIICFGEKFGKEIRI